MIRISLTNYDIIYQNNLSAGNGEVAPTFLAIIYFGPLPLGFNKRKHSDCPVILYYKNSYGFSNTIHSRFCPI